jgi:hypothetical protein
MAGVWSHFSHKFSTWVLNSPAHLFAAGHCVLTQPVPHLQPTLHTVKKKTPETGSVGRRCDMEVPKLRSLQDDQIFFLVLESLVHARQTICTWGVHCHPQPFLFIWDKVSWLPLARLTSNPQSSCLCLPSSWDYRCVSPHPASFLFTINIIYTWLVIIEHTHGYSVMFWCMSDCIQLTCRGSWCDIWNSLLVILKSMIMCPEYIQPAVISFLIGGVCVPGHTGGEWPPVKKENHTHTPKQGNYCCT